MKKVSVGVCAALFALAVTSTVWAGLRSTYNISVTASSFSGSLGSVRNSATAGDYIGCTLYAGSITCAGRSGTTNYKGCSTTNPDFIEIARHLSPSSYLFVSFNADAECLSVRSSTWSYLAPPVD